jgi:NADPH2:quinone reductase
MGAWVIGAASSPEKLELARRCGADAVVDYRTEPLADRVKELTDGAGVDVLFDPVGGADFREYLRTLAWTGRYLVVGFAGGEIPQLGLNLVLLKSVSLIGVAYGASVTRDPALNDRLFAQLFAWYAEGKLATVIGQRFPLDAAADAMRVVHDRGALGKVVVDVA